MIIKFKKKIQVIKSLQNFIYKHTDDSKMYKGIRKNKEKRKEREN